MRYWLVKLVDYLLNHGLVLLLLLLLGLLVVLLRVLRTSKQISRVDGRYIFSKISNLEI